LRHYAQLQHLAVSTEGNRSKRKQFVLVADPVNRAFYFFCWSVKRGLVSGEQQPSVFGNALKQFHLLLRNAFTVSKRCNVGQADIDENAVVGPRNLFQRSHLSGSRNADFKNRQRLRLLCGKHGQR
jgi:hypothetical protein